MSLRFKFVAAIATLILVLGIGGTLHARFTLSSFSTEELDRRALALSRDIEEHAGELLLTNDVYGLYDRVNEVLLTSDDVRYVVVMDDQGTVRATTFPDGLPVGLREANLVPVDEEYSLTRLTTNEGNVVDVAYPIRSGAGGTVRLGLSEERLGNQVERLTFTLLALTGIVLLAGLAIGYLLATVLTRPLSRLAEAARAVGRGELSQRVDISTHEEVGQVAEAFNSMTDDLRKKEEERRQLMSRIVAAHEEERKRISRELHDEAGQALTSLLLGLKHLEDGCADPEHRSEVSQMRVITARTLDMMRDMALELRPSVLDDLGLVAALRRYVAVYGDKHELDMDFHGADLDGAGLAPAAETALYRITQEALTNIVRHADAHSVNVLLERRNGHVVLVVEDDGSGFDVSALGQTGPSGKLGILGMEERAGMVGGRMTIESHLGGGTALFVEVPLRRSEDGTDKDRHR